MIKDIGLVIMLIPIIAILLSIAEDKGYKRLNLIMLLFCIGAVMYLSNDLWP